MWVQIPLLSLFYLGIQFRGELSFDNLEISLRIVVCGLNKNCNIVDQIKHKDERINERLGLSGRF
jgi:hypothetical protein